MQPLRQTRSIARLVLAWFALFVAVATISPIARPQSLELICSAGAVKLVAQDADGTPAPSGHAMECPLCLLPAAPPPSSAGPAVPPLPAQLAVDAPASHPVAALALPPLPPRGPPSQLSIA